MLKKSLLNREFKNSKCKEQIKFKIDAYLYIRENLKFMKRRSNWKNFNSLINALGKSNLRCFSMGLIRHFQKCRVIEIEHGREQNRGKRLPVRIIPGH